MTKRFWIVTASIIISVLAISGTAYAVFAYTVYAYQPDSRAARVTADLLGIPAAVVVGRKVPYTEYLRHLDALKAFLAGPSARAQGFPTEPTVELKQETLNRVVRIAMVEALAKEKAFVITPLDVERAYDELVARAGTSTTAGDIRAFLEDEFGWSEQEFQHNVVRPALLEDGLRAKEAREKGGDLKAFDAVLEERLKNDVRIRIRL
jgi:hypothetical protein